MSGHTCSFTHFPSSIFFIIIYQYFLHSRFILIKTLCVLNACVIFSNLLSSTPLLLLLLLLLLFNVLSNSHNMLSQKFQHVPFFNLSVN